MNGQCDKPLDALRSLNAADGKAVAILIRKAILNTQQVADLLGTHIETIRRLARKGAIPSFKVGKDWRFERRALLKWADDGSVRLDRAKPNVLVVDDNPSICKQVHRVLEPVGCQVHSTYTGIAGLISLQARHMDLVLLDLKMPGMTGPVFLGHFRESHPDTPVIIITGYPDSDLMGEAMIFGPLMLLAKPFDKQQLLSAAGVVLKPFYQGKRLVHNAML